jgi:tryptophan synthase beta chain
MTRQTWPMNWPESIPTRAGRYGPFGGRYVPETLFASFEKLEAGIKQHLHAADFQAELHEN